MLASEYVHVVKLKGMASRASASSAACDARTSGRDRLSSEVGTVWELAADVEVEVDGVVEPDAVVADMLLIGLSKVGSQARF